MHPDETAETLVILGTDGEAELEALAAAARALSIRHAVFAEPDLGNSKTAIALGPGSKKPGQEAAAGVSRTRCL
jgi:hypothetical protein